MSTSIRIGSRSVGPGRPVYVIAEISANHHGDYDEAQRLLRAARDAGANAVKLQTYSPDTMTLRDRFPVGEGTLWAGEDLYDLYRRAATPREWHGGLMALAAELGLDFFSTAFDVSAVDFLEGLGVPLHKVASFEIVDIPLIEKMARTGKPLLLSTGMATLAEIQEAVEGARSAGARQIGLLKCTSAYPAAAGDMNLRTIVHLAETFGLPVGLSDHSLDLAVPVAAVALGACVVEKHLTLSREVPGPDRDFSLEPQEFGAMVKAVRCAEEALGDVFYGPSPSEVPSLQFRRSLFVVEEVRAGEILTEDSVLSLRPGYGLHPRHRRAVVGRRAARDIPSGTPLTWELIAGEKP